MTWQVGLYAAAVLIPLAAFTVEAIFIRQLKRFNAYLATGAIGLSCLLSLIGFVDYSIESGFYAHARRNRRQRGGARRRRRATIEAAEGSRAPSAPGLVRQPSTGSSWEAGPRGSPGLVVPLGVCDRQPERRSCS